VIGTTGGSLGPVVRRKAASWRVEWSGSLVVAASRGTNLGKGGVGFDLFCLKIGVEGTLRTARPGGEVEVS